MGRLRARAHYICVTVTSVVNRGRHTQYNISAHVINSESRKEVEPRREQSRHGISWKTASMKARREGRNLLVIREDKDGRTGDGRIIRYHGAVVADDGIDGALELGRQLGLAVFDGGVGGGQAGEKGEIEVSRIIPLVERQGDSVAGLGRGRCEGEARERFDGQRGITGRATSDEGGYVAK